MSDTLTRHGWRPVRPHKPDFMGKTPESYPATRFFDQLSFIGDPGVACFLLETGEGLVLLDCMNPDRRCVVHTPGHTKGCMSFIVPVTDEGRPHAMALWGGTGILPDSDPDDYLASVEKFHRVCAAEGVDGEIATHPFVDCSIQRLEVINHIVDGVPNPFVLGWDGYVYYENMFRALALRAQAARNR